MPTSAKRPSVRVGGWLIAALCAAAVLAGCAVPSQVSPDGHHGSSDSSHSNAGSDSAPGTRMSFFPVRQAAMVNRVVDPQAVAAHQLMAGWWSTHGSHAHDKAFSRWLSGRIPAPPAPKVRRAELVELKSIARTRTDSGLSAAEWLDNKGTGPAWASLAKRTGAGSTRSGQGDLGDAMSMANNVAGTLKDSLGQPSPYMLDPGLRAGQKTKGAGKCPCSFPSSHAAVAAAASTFLSGIDASHATEYRRFRNQVDFSRLYVAGHVPSDLAAGALIGDAVGEYFLRTRASAS